MLFLVAGSNSIFLLVYQPRTPASHILHGRKDFTIITHWPTLIPNQTPSVLHSLNLWIKKVTVHKALYIA